MSSVISPFAGIARLATSAFMAAMILGVGVTFNVTKRTPTGPSASRNIQCWRTSSGGQQACISETGVLRLSGAIVSNGTTISGYSAGQGLNLNGSAFQVNTTLTGSILKRWTTISGATLHADNQLQSSGSLIVKGTARIERIVAFPLCDGATACAVGSGAIFRIPKIMNNYILSGATLDASTAGTTSTMTVQVQNITQNKNFFSTKISIDSAEPSSDTAATPYVLGNTAAKTVVNGDILVPRVDQVHTTPAKGVTLELHFIPL